MKTHGGVLLACLVLLLSKGVTASDHRIGFGSMTAVTQFHDVSHHRLLLSLPWTSQQDNILQPDDVQIGVGILRRNGEVSRLYSLGPSWRWQEPIDRCRCFLEGGISVAYLDGTQFHDPVDGRMQDFGYDLEFITRLSVGLVLDRQERWALALSVQHISNGGIGHVNPGADFVGAELERRF